jgi:hypothetical protein
MGAKGTGFQQRAVRVAGAACWWHGCEQRRFACACGARARRRTCCCRCRVDAVEAIDMSETVFCSAGALPRLLFAVGVRGTAPLLALLDLVPGSGDPPCACSGRAPGVGAGAAGGFGLGGTGDCDMLAAAYAAGAGLLSRCRRNAAPRRAAAPGQPAFGLRHLRSGAARLLRIAPQCESLMRDA